MGSYAPTTNQEENSGIPAAIHFYPGVCGTCYSMPSEDTVLLRCSQCQLVSYCSKICQKKDWSIHKPLCMVNKAVNNQNIFSTARDIRIKKEWKQWLQFQTNLALNCSLNMDKALTTKEREMFLYPRVCEVCKESNSSLLIDCNTCHCAFYCCVEHKEKDKETHSRWCKHYLLSLECDSVEAKNGIQDLPFPTVVDETYSKLPKDLMNLLDPQLRVDRTRVLDHRFVTMIGERLSFPLSLHYALEKIEHGRDGKSFLTSSELTIHVIGAESSIELLGIIRWEYFLHRLPSLSKLHIVFIGPDLFKSFETVDDFEMEKHCLDDTGSTRCADCIRKNRIVVYEMATMLYHEYEESSHYNEPDAVVAFNCGFHEFEESSDTWTQSIQLITKTNIPLVFTSYTQLESEKDLEFVKRNNQNLEVKFGAEKNPFCSRRPLRDASRECDEQFFFFNQYISCIQGAKENS